MSETRRSCRLKNKPNLVSSLQAYTKKKYGENATPDMTYIEITQDDENAPKLPGKNADKDYKEKSADKIQSKTVKKKLVSDPTEIEDLFLCGFSLGLGTSTTKDDTTIITTTTNNDTSQTTEVKETRIRDGKSTIIKSVKTITTLTVVENDEDDAHRRTMSEEEVPAVGMVEQVSTIESPVAETSLQITGLNHGNIVISKETALMKVPRSDFNQNFIEVYKAGPKLRNVSPPRFTTRRVKKAKIDFSKMGVKKLEKVSGNPYSKRSTRRNSLVYGNKDLEQEEINQIEKLDVELKSVIAAQTGGKPKNSYVDVAMLKDVKKKLGIKSPVPKKQADYDDEIDIESIDDTEKPEKMKKNTKVTKDRRVGHTTLQCDMCGYKTTHSGHMKVHVISVHQQVRKYQCQYDGCTYKSTRKGTMVRHEKCVHRKNVLYKCPRENCEFESAWTKSLERHVITVHEQLRPWKCELCSFSAGQRYTLQLHMRSIHKGIKNIICSFCDFRATTRRVVKHHIERKHADKIAKENENEE